MRYETKSSHAAKGFGDEVVRPIVEGEPGQTEPATAEDVEAAEEADSESLQRLQKDLKNLATRIRGIITMVKGDGAKELLGQLLEILAKSADAIGSFEVERVAKKVAALQARFKSLGIG